MITIKIGNKVYKVKEAKSESEKEKGLLNVKELPEDEGMLFYFEPPEDVNFWMKDTLIPLDIVFIDEDLEVISVKQGTPNDDTFISEKEVAYVLEVNLGSNIQKGDELDFEEESIPVMKVLNQDGTSLMELEGGERIFRRIFTKLLINAIKKADSLKADESKFDALCRVIGRKMFKEIHALDNRDPEYVESK